MAEKRIQFVPSRVDGASGVSRARPLEVSTTVGRSRASCAKIVERFAIALLVLALGCSGALEAWRSRQERLNSALFDAASNGDLPHVRALLSLGASPNPRRDELTPLAAAVLYEQRRGLAPHGWFDYPSVIRTLESHGAERYVADPSGDMVYPIGPHTPWQRSR